MKSAAREFDPNRAAPVGGLFGTAQWVRAGLEGARGLVRALGIAVLLASASEPQAPPRANIHTTPYPLDADKPAPIAGELWTLSVPENRDEPGSRHIELCFVRLPSTAALPGAPIVYLAGGPGSSGIEARAGTCSGACVPWAT